MVRAIDKWLAPFLRSRLKSPTTPVEHLVIAVCDHFEPFHNRDQKGAVANVKKWQQEYENCSSEFRGADGGHPRHTFFYPIEQYDEEVISTLAQLCHDSQCETEIHLHHEDDDAASLEAKLEKGIEQFSHHNLLCSDTSGAKRFGFIHGNWAINNSHPSGKHCGVDGELKVLRQCGCYADFTMPSAPDQTQVGSVNQIYYADVEGTHACGTIASQETGGLQPERLSPDRLLMVQGPLGLDWRRRKFGLLPRLENADLTSANPPTASRAANWIDWRIHVGGRPDIAFAKLHTHGALSHNTQMFLGLPMQEFHRALAALEGISICYATAREMVNMIHAAEDGCTGAPEEYRDYLYRLA